MDLDAHHCAVNVADTGEALEFYRDELGLEIVRQWEGSELQGTVDGLADRDGFDVADTSAEITYLDAGGFYVELVEYHRPPNRDANELLGNDTVGRVHLCFSVPDLRSFYQSCRDRLEFVSRPIMTTNGGLMVKCYDPSGTLVEFLEPGDADEEGSNRAAIEFHHYGINTNDVASSIEFYRDRFGWEVLTEYSPPGSVDEYASGLSLGCGVTRLAFLDAGGCEIELLEYPNADNENPAMAEVDIGRPHLGVRVDDSEEIFEVFSDTMQFLSEPRASSRDAVVTKCRAHEGYTMEFIEPPEWLP